MPALFRPGVRMPVHLQCDMDIPIDERPTFYFRAVSYEEATGRMQELWNDFLQTPVTQKEKERAAMRAFLSEYLIGWANMNHPETGEEIPFAVDTVMQWVTPAELLEIGRDAFYLTTPNTLEKKS